MADKTITVEMDVKVANLIVEALDVAVRHDTNEMRRNVARKIESEIVAKLHDA